MKVNAEAIAELIQEDSDAIKSSCLMDKSETAIGIVNGCYVTLTVYSKEGAESRDLESMFEMEPNKYIEADK